MSSEQTQTSISIEELSDRIIEVMKSARVPLKINEIGKSLSISSTSPEYDVLLATLDLLIENAIVKKTTRRRFILASNEMPTTFVGILECDNTQSGTLRTSNATFPIIHIRQKDMGTALHGDTIEVKLLAMQSKKKPRGFVLKVIERSSKPIAGTIELSGDFVFFAPDDEHYYYDFLVSYKKLKGAKPGDKVLARFLEWDNPHQSPSAEIVEVIGRTGDNRIEFDAVVKEFSLPTRFDDNLELEAHQRAEANYDLSNRIDIRNELVVTIDPDDAKDFDDALSLREFTSPEGYPLVELGVHIADVSTYLKDGSPLDAEAIARGNSTYLVDRVIPMLPEVLSNNVCSLVPNQDRLTYSCFMTFDNRGLLRDYRIEETIINSKRRYTYNEVQSIIETSEGDNAEFILKLNSLATLLRQRRYKDGGIDFDTSEIRYTLDENKNPIKATKKKRTDATGLVEECMLSANKTISEHIQHLRKKWSLKKTLPFLYRIHDEPDGEKLRSAIGFVRAMGIQVPNHKLTSKDINDIIMGVAELPESNSINQILLRAQAKAVYSGMNIGHYGLGFKDYSHFTSPIRRYPDVVVHRLLKEFAKGQPSRERMLAISEYIDEIADHTTATERRSVEAERASQKVAQTLIALQHLGGEFTGTVTGITSYGLFVLLDDIYAEGLCHLRDMDGDYFSFDEKNFRLIGKKTRAVYRFGSRITVQIINVNLRKRQIDLRLKSASA
jgi:ribonuclease R